MPDRQIARQFAEVYAKVWLLCYDIVKEQGGKIMTLQQILEEVKNGQLSVEHAENLLKKKDTKKWIMRNWIPQGKSVPVLQK